MKNQKGFANVAIAVLVVILVGAIGYFVLRKPTSAPVTQVVSPTFNQTPPPPQVGMVRYKNSQNFSIDYPTNWRLEPEGESGIAIYSYPANNSYNPGLPVPRNEVKIATVIFSNINTSLEEWINSLGFARNVLHTEDIVINGKSAKKILYSTEGEGGKAEILSVFYLDGSRGVVFTSYPHDTKYSQEFDAVVKNFRFTN